MSRKTGIDIVGNVPPAAHLCQFYRTKEDISDILVPYFKAGLESNELCLWVTAAPLEAAEAFEALKAALPDLDRYLSSGQLRIVPYTECYTEPGSRGPRDLLHQLAATAGNGFTGIRLADQAALLAVENGATSDRNESGFGPWKYPLLALCVYPLDACETTDVLNAIRSHKVALIKQNGRWEALGVNETGRPADRDDKSSANIKYQDLFNNTLEAMEVIDAASGRILLANPAAARMFGFDSPEDMIGVDPLDYIPPEDRDRTAGMIAEYMFEKDLHKVVDVRVITKDGRLLWVSAMGVRTEYQGKLAGLVSMRDITVQKEAENAFRESQEQLMAIFDGVKDGIALLDLEGRVVLVNKRVLEVSGYSEHELLDKRFDKLPMINGQATPQLLKAKERILSREGEVSVEMEARVKSGERLCLEVRKYCCPEGHNRSPQSGRTSQKQRESIPTPRRACTGCDMDHGLQSEVHVRQSFSSQPPGLLCRGSHGIFSRQVRRTGIAGDCTGHHREISGLSQVRRNQYASRESNGYGGDPERRHCGVD